MEMSARQAAVIVALTSLWAAPTVAAPVQSEVTGNKLYELCSQTDASMAGFLGCRFYIDAVIDDAAMMDTSVAPGAFGSKFRFCLRPSVTSAQVRDVVLDYLRDNPSVRDTNAAVLVRLSLSVTFPCSTQ